MNTETNTLAKEQWHLETAIPGLVLSELSRDDLADIEELFDKNYSHFARGGIGLVGDRLKDEMENGQPEGVRRLAIRLDGALVGYAGVIQEDMNVSEVEISYAIDSDHTKKGIALATVAALRDYETQQGNDVVAEVEDYNTASMRVLEKAGFMREMKRQRGRAVFRVLSYSDENLMRRLNNM